MDSCSYTKIRPNDDVDSSVVYTGKAVGLVYPSTAPAAAKKKKVKRSRSCCKTCLWVTLVLFGLVVGLTICAGVKVYMLMAGVVQQYTVVGPMADMPDAVLVPEEDLTVLKDQAVLFLDTIQAGGSAPPPNDVTVTETNLNGLASASDFLRGKAYAWLQRNEVTVDLSLPTDGLPGGKGRYLVAKNGLTWDPESSELRTYTTVRLEDDGEAVIYDATFHLGRTTNGDDRWNLNLVNLQYPPMDWTAPRDFIDEDSNLLDLLYDADCSSLDDNDGGDYMEACEHSRNALHGLTNIFLNEEEIVFQAGSNDNQAQHRVLVEAVKVLSNKPDWKIQLARYLVGF